MPVVPVAEQEVLSARLAAALAAIASQKIKVAEMAESLTNLDRATMAKAFRGELVPQDPNDEPADVMLARLNAQTNGDSDQGYPKPTKKRSRGRSNGAQAEET